MSRHHLLRGNSRKLILFLFDVACFLGIAGSYFWVSLLANREDTLNHSGVYLINTAILLGCCMFYRLIFHIYSNVWRYANTVLYFMLTVSDALGGVTALIIALIFKTYRELLMFATIPALAVLLALVARFSYKLLYKRHRIASADSHPHINVAIIGAGQVGVLLVNDLRGNKRSIYAPKFFIDRDASKIGSKINGLKVYEEKTALIRELFSRYEISEVFIAVTSLDRERIAEMYEFYSQTGCKVKIYDVPIRDATSEEEGSVPRPTLREIRIEDLLFREPMNINDSNVFAFFANKVILVTGGGGSIGSELCRQLAKCKPQKLIILDIYENNAYEIQQELIRKYGDKLNLAVEIASVRDRERLDSVFRYHKPQIVFHAAAHKHVPLMEYSAGEAIKNNVCGTYNSADMAEKYGVEKFILISTDKAVNPTNVMGASKRLCEMVIQCRQDSKTNFAAVRFGNVLGSNGSVIPLFKRQIEQGGPVTITDKRIIRYFMTIPEASQLVMQSGAMAKKGELFVLDMGKPVRIYDLAVNMIKLAGLEPDVDVKIKEIGLRPGEKLYEELLMKTEMQEKTENDMIFIEKDMPLSRLEVDEKLKILTDAVEASERDHMPVLVRDAIAKVVPTFHLPEETNRSAEKSEEMLALSH